MRAVAVQVGSAKGRWDGRKRGHHKVGSVCSVVGVEAGMAWEPEARCFSNTRCRVQIWEGGFWAVAPTSTGSVDVPKPPGSRGRGVDLSDEVGNVPGFQGRIPLGGAGPIGAGV